MSAVLETRLIDCPTCDGLAEVRYRGFTNASQGGPAERWRVDSATCDTCGALPLYTVPHEPVD